MQSNALIRAGAICVVLLSMFAGVIAVAQKTAPAGAKKPDQTKAGSPQDDKPQRIGVLSVRLPVSVKHKNLFVPDLTQQNFEVYEDNKKQVIDSFQAPSQLPLRIGLLVDTSESVKLKLKFE